MLQSGLARTDEHEYVGLFVGFCRMVLLARFIVNSKETFNRDMNTAESAV